MRFKEIALFCSLFLGIAFSQDSSFAQIPIPADTAIADTLNAVSPDSLGMSSSDSLRMAGADSLSADSLAASADTLGADSIAAGTDTAATKISKGLHFFISAGAQFITFNERMKFQNLLDDRFAEIEAMREEMIAAAAEDSSGVEYPLPEKQDFQNVNLAFPLSAGLIWHFSDMHSLGIGAGFLYNSESVILTDMNGKIQNFRYVLQAFPLFAEYRLQISPDIISLREGDYFSIFLRYYWMLPHTEIYSSWGKAAIDFEPLGNGYGIFMGYRFWEWESLSFWGEMGLLSIDVKSSDKDRVLNSWNLGGISFLVRIMM